MQASALAPASPPGEGLGLSQWALAPVQTLNPKLEYAPLTTNVRRIRPAEVARPSALAKQREREGLSPTDQRVRTFELRN